MNLPLRLDRVIPSTMLGLSLAMASWVCWTGCLLVTGQLVPRYSAGEVRALMALPHERLERRLVAEPVMRRELQHLGADEALDQREHAGIGAALHLRHEPPLGRGQERQGFGTDERVREEFLREVEAAAEGSAGAPHPPVKPVPGDPALTTPPISLT